MPHSALMQPITLGRHTLTNRIVLPPLTRQRSGQPGNVPTDLMALYYQQRASAGLIVTEGTQIEPRGQGYAWTPGIYTDEQIAGWRKVRQGRGDFCPALARWSGFPYRPATARRRTYRALGVASAKGQSLYRNRAEQRHLGRAVDAARAERC